MYLKLPAVGDAKSSAINIVPPVDAGNPAAVENVVVPKIPTFVPVSVMDEFPRAVVDVHFEMVLAVPDPVNVPPPVGAAQVPSALKKFVVPPPDAGTNPFRVELKTSNNIVG